MDLYLIQKDCDKAFMGKWIDFGLSKLQLNFATFACEEIQLSKKIKHTISTDDLAFLITSKILVNWSGLKDPAGNEVPFNKSVAFNVLANDLEFQKIVTDAAFNRSNFV